MQSPLTFDHPWLLLLLPLACLAFWALARHSFAGLPPQTQMLALITRCLLASLLILALAGAHLVKHSDKLTTLFLYDVSQSVSRAQQKQGLDYINQALASKPNGDQAGVIEFGRTASLDEAPSETVQQWDAGHASVTGDATDLASALRLAQASFPSGLGRKIVVLSDGNENVGAASEEIARLRSDGVRVDVSGTALGLDKQGAVSSEAMVDDVSIPASARVDAPFVVRVVVSSTVAQTASLALERDGQPLGTEQVQLKAGKNAFTFTEAVHNSGFHRYDAVLTPAQDTIADNNHGYGYVSVLGRPRVLYISDATDGVSVASFRNAMAAQQIDVDAQTPGAIPANVAALASYDAVVLSDVPAEELGTAQMSALEEATKNFGVGLGMIGGPSSFAAGQYSGTPIEDALPVQMDIKDKKRFPSVAVALVIEDLEEPGNVNMSIEAAKAVVGILEPIDQVGVEDCNGQWRIPMQPVLDRAKIQSQMDGLTDMNDPPVYDPYLVEAARVLSTTKAQVKHIIFLGDGDAVNESGQSAGALQKIRAMGITVSTVATGADSQGIQFMAGMASVGGGKAYVAERAEDLPRILLKDQQTVSKLRIIEEPFLARPALGDDVIGGIDWPSQPPLLGYNISSAKPGATVALTAPDHSDPVFAYWRYGLGRTFAFTSDDQPHWAVHWLGWPGYNRFWAQTLRWALRSNTHADFQTVVDNSEGRGHVVVDAFTQNGGFVNQAAMNAQVVGPDLVSRPVALSQTAPGRYEGTFGTDQTGAYLVNVRSAAANQTAGLVVPYSPEYRTLGPNLPLLTQLAEGTGGKIGEGAEAVFRDAPSWVVGVRDLAPGLLLWAALLFLGDVAVRRLMIRPGQVQENAVRGAEVVGSRLAAARDARGRPGSAPSSPQIGRLLERKSASRANLPEEQEAATAQLLNRRAARTQELGDEPFPYVAAARPKPKPAEPPSSAEPGSAYTNRLLEAKRRAKEKDE